jgi:Ca2+-binding RTX toxin-like protein
MLEALENRCMFDAVPTFQLTSKGTLIITGTAGPDLISVQLRHGKPSDGIIATRTFNNREVQSGERVDAHYAFGRVKRFRMEGGDGNDVLDYGGGSLLTKPATLLGQAGDDTLNFSVNALVLADGGDGNDLVKSPSNISATYLAVFHRHNRDVLDFNLAPGHYDEQPCTLIGGDGDDTMGGDGNDVIDGGNGNDTGRVLILETDLPADRKAALAHDYFARLNTTGLESTTYAE